jgi:hypothetical protein
MFLFVVVINVLLIVEIPSDVQQGLISQPIRRPNSTKRDYQNTDVNIEKYYLGFSSEMTICSQDLLLLRDDLPNLL